MLSPRQIHITEQEIQQSTSFSTMTITPDMVYKIAYNNAREIYIYLATNQIIILRKNWLENGQWADFVTFIKKNWEPKK
ncbi:YcxB family protein [Lactococcus ileimucosae]|uniref:YcxB family protein n=1 Tax=Lactococcus ileimucosae TaxID=2941329 RepID=UPI002043F9CD|nr:YcxB family protein [Lactococcus ileimucosae]